MKRNGIGVKSVSKFRRQAEKMLTKSAASLKRISTTDIRSLREDFQIYRVELEDQNKKLVRMENDLKRAGEALRQGEMRYRTLFREPKNPVNDGDGKIREPSAKWFDLYGFDDETGVLGKDVLQSIHDAFIKSQQAFRLPL
jgi:hypothetical protein